MEQVTTLNAQQAAALASPTRGAVYERLASRGEATAVDVASEVGITAATALYHLRQLASVGLVVEAGERPSGKRPAVVFRPAAKQLRLPDDNAALRVPIVKTSMRKFARQLEATGGEGAHILRIAARLSPEDLATFKDMLEKAADFAKSHSSPDGEEVGWFSLACPPKRRGRVQ